MKTTRFVRALLLTTWLYSMLLWVYIVFRIVVNRVYMYNPFTTAIPFISFYTLGIASFVVSFVSLLAYLSTTVDENKNN